MQLDRNQNCFDKRRDKNFSFTLNDIIMQFDRIFGIFVQFGLTTRRRILRQNDAI